MNNVPLPQTDLAVSPVCLGLASLGINQTDSDIDQLLGSFLHGGGNFLDTARVYSDWVPGERCRSEKALGRWLKSRGGRHELVIGTKGGHPDILSPVPKEEQDYLAPENLRRDLEESLSHLKTDYIDLYWLHRDDPRLDPKEILETLEQFVKEGKIRYYGCSNWTLARLSSAQEKAGDKGWRGFCANQIEWSAAKRNPETQGDPSMLAMDRAFFDFHRETGLPVIPYASQAQGCYSKVGQQGWEPKYDLPVNREIYGLLKAYGDQTGLDMAALSLAYHLSQRPPVLSVPILGSSRPRRIADSLSQTGIRLPAGLIGKINDRLWS